MTAPNRKRRARQWLVTLAAVGVVGCASTTSSVQTVPSAGESAPPGTSSSKYWPWNWGKSSEAGEVTKHSGRRGDEIVRTEVVDPAPLARPAAAKPAPVAGDPSILLVGRSSEGGESRPVTAHFPVATPNTQPQPTPAAAPTSAPAAASASAPSSIASTPIASTPTPATLPIASRPLVEARPAIDASYDDIEIGYTPIPGDNDPPSSSRRSSWSNPWAAPTAVAGQPTPAGQPAPAPQTRPAASTVVTGFPTRVESRFSGALPAAAAPNTPTPVAAPPSVPLMASIDTRPPMSGGSSPRAVPFPTQETVAQRSARRELPIGDVTVSEEMPTPVGELANIPQPGSQQPTPAQSAPVAVAAIPVRSDLLPQEGLPTLADEPSPANIVRSQPTPTPAPAQTPEVAPAVAPITSVATTPTSSPAPTATMAASPAPVAAPMPSRAVELTPVDSIPQPGARSIAMQPTADPVRTMIVDSIPQPDPRWRVPTNEAPLADPQSLPQGVLDNIPPPARIARPEPIIEREPVAVASIDPRQTEPAAVDPRLPVAADSEPTGRWAQPMQEVAPQLPAATPQTAQPAVIPAPAATVETLATTSPSPRAFDGHPIAIDAAQEAAAVRGWVEAGKRHFRQVRNYTVRMVWQQKDEHGKDRKDAADLHVRRQPLAIHASWNPDPQQGRHWLYEANPEGEFLMSEHTSLGRMSLKATTADPTALAIHRRPITSWGVGRLIEELDEALFLQSTGHVEVRFDGPTDRPEQSNLQKVVVIEPKSREQIEYYIDSKTALPVLAIVRDRHGNQTDYEYYQKLECNLERLDAPLAFDSDELFRR